MKLKEKLEALGFIQSKFIARQYYHESLDLCVYVDDDKITSVQIVTSWFVKLAPFNYKEYMKKVNKIFKALNKLL